MGNRAVITTKENFADNGIGIYVHWNGGRDSVEAFLKYCELRGFRAPDEAQPKSGQLGEEKIHELINKEE